MPMRTSDSAGRHGVRLTWVVAGNGGPAHVSDTSAVGTGAARGGRGTRDVP